MAVQLKIRWNSCLEMAAITVSLQVFFLLSVHEVTVELRSGDLLFPLTIAVTGKYICRFSPAVTCSFLFVSMSLYVCLLHVHLFLWKQLSTLFFTLSALIAMFETDWYSTRVYIRIIF